MTNAAAKPIFASAYAPDRFVCNHGDFVRMAQQSFNAQIHETTVCGAGIDANQPHGKKQNDDWHPEGTSNMSRVPAIEQRGERLVWG